jgi:hypothetical protein
MYKIDCMPFQRDTAWRAAFRLSDMAYWTLPTEYNLCYVYLRILHLSRQVKMLTESRRLGPPSRNRWVVDCKALSRVRSVFVQLNLTLRSPVPKECGWGSCAVRVPLFIS